jgi:hypothetical protein
MNDYKEKLKDPRWQKKRLEIFNRDKFACICCGSKEKELQVHHLKYLGNPWDVDNIHLETLCKDCHGLKTYCDNLDNINVSIKKALYINNWVIFILSNDNICVSSKTTYKPLFNFTESSMIKILEYLKQE